MKLIKDKIKKIEDAEKVIDNLNELSKTCEASHLDHAVCFINGGSLSSGIAIDADLFDVTIKSQIERLENSIADDKAFVMGIELMLSKSNQGEG